jgi:hypothetical protein
VLVCEPFPSIPVGSLTVLDVVGFVQVGVPCWHWHMTAARQALPWRWIEPAGPTWSSLWYPPREATQSGVQVRRLLGLTLLAPEVVERLLGTPGAALERVMRRAWPRLWADKVRGLSQEGRDAKGCSPGPTGRTGSR